MSTEMADMVLDETREKMQRAVSHTKGEFSSIRTGRAAPALVEKIPVEYYGSEVPLQQLASFQVPEARQLLITPYDKGSMGAIEKAITKSDIGLTPNVDGTVVRLNIPALTEERRKDLVKLVHKRMEEARVEIRNHRRDVGDDVKKAEKAGDLTADDSRRELELLQKVTDRWTAEVDRVGKHKETEIMDVG